MKSHYALLFVLLFMASHLRLKGQCELGGASLTFDAYRDSVHIWIVPADITSIHISATGADGATLQTINTDTLRHGGSGAALSATMEVRPGDTLQLMPGLAGTTSAGVAGPHFVGGGGGGGTGVTVNGEIVMVAGGGGGELWNIWHRRSRSKRIHW